MKNGISVKDNLVNLIAKIGEKITIRRACFFDNNLMEKFFLCSFCYVEKNIGKIISVVKLDGIVKRKNIELDLKLLCILQHLIH